MKNPIPNSTPYNIKGDNPIFFINSVYIGIKILTIVAIAKAAEKKF